MKSAWNVSLSQVFVSVLVVLAATSALAACGSAASTFNSKAELAGSSPIVSLLTINNRPKDDWAYGMYSRGLTAGLTSALEACGVKSRILQVDPLELTVNDRIEQGVNEFHPNAVLHIKAVDRTTIVSEDGTRSEEWTFELKVFDAVSKKQIWLARVKPEFRGRYIKPGIDFATRIASRLRDDGVLRGCPTDAAGWPVVPPLPSCEDERRSTIAQAQRTTDMAERKRLIDAMPICE